jgi:hypothetical protein
MAYVPHGSPTSWTWGYAEQADMDPNQPPAKLSSYPLTLGKDVPHDTPTGIGFSAYPIVLGTDTNTTIPNLTVTNVLKAGSLQATGYSSPSTGTNANYYAELGQITLTAQGGDAGGWVLLTGIGPSGRVSRGWIFWRCNQSAALGNAPNVELYLVDADIIGLSQVVAVITTVSSTQSVVELFVQDPNQNESLLWTPVLFNNNASASVSWTSGAALVSALPAGTQVTASPMAETFGAATFAGAVTVNGNLTMGSGTSITTPALTVQTTMIISPASAAPPAASASNVGQIYFQTGGGTAQSKLFVAAETSTGTYEWIQVAISD